MTGRSKSRDRNAASVSPPAIDLVCVFASALAFYSATLAPTVIWSDSAFLAIDVFFRSLHFSSASDHPLFLLVGWLFARLPGELARNLNFEAAVFGALAVMLVYRCARQLGTSRAAASIGAAALAVSHAFWQHSVITEVYTANAFFLAASLNLLLEWRHSRRWAWLLAATIVFTIGLTNHLVLAVLAPGAFLFVLATNGRGYLRWRSLAFVAPLFIALAALAVAVPESVSQTLRHIWYGPPGIAEYLGPDFDFQATAREAGFYIAYLIYQFPSIALVLGGIGVWALVREQRAVAALLLVTIVVNAATFIRHTVWPSAGSAKYVFYISDYVVFAMMCAYGADHLLKWAATGGPRQRRAWALALLASVALLPPALYAAAPSVTTRAGIDLVHARSLPYRDNRRFFLNPNKRGEDGARRFGEEALRLAPPSAVIFADYTPFSVLRYLQIVEQRRRDVLLVAPAVVSARVPVRWIFENGRRRPTYLAALTPGYYDLSGLTGSYDFVPAGPMLEIRPHPDD